MTAPLCSFRLIHLLLSSSFLSSIHDRISLVLLLIRDCSMESIADILLCGDIEEQFGHVRFLVIYGWRPFFDLLFNNMLYEQKVLYHHFIILSSFFILSSFYNSFIIIFHFIIILSSFYQFIILPLL
jgi:hypothetical protein